MTAAKTLILAVEDEPRNTALLKAILLPAGYAMETVERLAETRAWLAGRQPDLILLDRHLPDGDGLDLARECKADPATRSIPIVLLSASVLPADESAAAAAGCDAFVPKPLRVAVLLETIARLTASRPAG